jgi:hypothetical protein
VEPTLSLALAVSSPMFLWNGSQSFISDNRLHKPLWPRRLTTLLEVL